MAEVDKMNTAFTDEATIPMDGMVNSPNDRSYCSRKTRGWMRVTGQKTSCIRPASTLPS